MGFQQREIQFQRRLNEHTQGKIYYLEFSFRKVFNKPTKKISGKANIINTIIRILSEIFARKINTPFPKRVNNFIAFLSKVVPFGQSLETSPRFHAMLSPRHAQCV